MSLDDQLAVSGNAWSRDDAGPLLRRALEAEKALLESVDQPAIFDWDDPAGDSAEEAMDILTEAIRKLKDENLARQPDPWVRIEHPWSEHQRKHDQVDRFWIDQDTTTVYGGPMLFRTNTS